MYHQGATNCALIYVLFLIWTSCQSYTHGHGLKANQTAVLTVNASKQSARQMPEKLFGIFFEEINHAGNGGLWAELVNNTGFESGGQTTPSNIDPWNVIGDDTSIYVYTERTSCFRNNKVALRMEVLCDVAGSNVCPSGGVGVYNPGFWGMNIEQGKSYNVILHIKSRDTMDLSVSLTNSDGSQELASAKVISNGLEALNWTKVELKLEPSATNRNSRLQITTQKKGVIWLDQISVMPNDTYKGHGFRKDLISMILDLKPKFFRFPGGCFVEGENMRNAFRWKTTIGPWEERPGHMGDVWHYWTDDGFGYYEGLQLAEDIGASIIWVFNNGVAHRDSVPTGAIQPFIQECLESIEFARGSADSKWGSVRAAMGHPGPFELKYIAVGNEDCGKPYYADNYLKFYNAIRNAYPDIQIIYNCDGSTQPLDRPADLYDYHVYDSANNIFSLANHFDKSSRTGAKAFVSEYAVHGADAGNGNLLAALAESAFLMGLEKNSDVVELACYAPLFVNSHDITWVSDAIWFDSWQSYGTPSYWTQVMFRESSGAILLNTTIQANSYIPLVASSIIWQSSEDYTSYLKIKIVNFGNDTVNLNISVVDMQNCTIEPIATTTILTSSNVMDENSFSEPHKVIPVKSVLPNAGPEMNVVISPNSLNSFELQLSSAS